MLGETELFYERRFKTEYCGLSPEYKTLRHIGAHAAKAGSKLIEYQRDQRSLEDIIKEVIPDLGLYRSLIAVVEPKVLAEGPLSPLKSAVIEPSKTPCSKLWVHSPF